MARSDAQRNRTKILETARAAGEPLSMAELARRAGVGMATVYRNFASRQELLEALFADEVDALVAAADELTLGPWLRRLYGFLQSKHPIGDELLGLTGGDATALDRGRDRIAAAAEPLVTAAREAGEVRGDLSVDQILDVVKAVARVPGDRAYVEPILEATLDGLRPPR